VATTDHAQARLSGPAGSTFKGACHADLKEGLALARADLGYTSLS